MIDENKLKEQMFALVEQIGDERLHIDAVVHLIDDAPAVDAVPAIHGKWQTNRLDDAYCVCTVCKKVTRIPRYVGGMLYAYCPHCGARMDGKGNGNETD